MSESFHAGLTGANLHQPGDHASTHTDGSDDIQSATGSQKGLATAAQITKLNGIDASADATPDASTTTKGKIEIATQGETDTGTDTVRAVTPATLANYSGLGSGGVTDHGALTGLSDDDHTQYHTDARGDARYPPLARSVSAGTGLSGGGDLSANRTISMPNSGVSAGSYTSADITVDAQGRVTVAANGSGGGGGSSPQIDFYTSGSGTWTKPSGATLVQVVCIGGGGGGGSGARGAAGSSRSGGAGGSGGARSDALVDASALGSTVAYIVGAGGAGGAAKSADGTGNAGSSGTSSVFGASPYPCRAGGGLSGGGGGIGGSVAGGTATSIADGDFQSGAGGATAATTASTGADAAAGGGGGGGGGITSANGTIASNVGGRNSHHTTNAAGGASGGGNAGTAGGTISGAALPGGGGGGGGQGNTGGTLAGGTGGAGGDYGGGGGGGGGSTTGANSGAGGAGGSGCVLVVTFF